MNKNNLLLLAQDVALPAQSTLVVGIAGSGKTRSILMPNLATMTGSNIVIDPRGYLFTTFAKGLRKAGVTVKRLDMYRPEASNRYNPFRYLRKRDGSLDVSRVNDLIEILMDRMNNINDRCSQDEFFRIGTKEFLATVVSYISESDKIAESEKNFGRMYDLIKDAAEDAGDGSAFDEQIKSAITDQDSFLGAHYSNFQKLSSKTRTSIAKQCFIVLLEWKEGLGPRIVTTDDEENESNNIRLEDITDEKTCIFVSLNPYARSFIPLDQIFLSQMIQTIYAKDQEPKKRGVCVAKQPVRIYLDEASACKLINLHRYLATAHSYDISFVLLYQDISQLKTQYPETWEHIVSCCDVTAFLGKYLSHETEELILNLIDCNHPLLLNKDEILIFTHGSDFDGRHKKMNFELHPNYNKTGEADPSNMLTDDEITSFLKQY